MSVHLHRVSRVVPCLAALVFALVISLALVAAPASEAKGWNGNGNGQAAEPAGDGGNGNGNGGGGQPAEAPADKPEQPADKPAKPADKPAKPAGGSSPATDKPSGGSKPAGDGGGHGATQGNSSSDPDGDSNGGADKPGQDGGFTADKDGNNGCGNDDDREDDNNGNCGGKPKTPEKDPSGEPSKPDNGNGNGPTPGTDNSPKPEAPDACPKTLLHVVLSWFGLGSDKCKGEAPAAQPKEGKVILCHATGSDKNPYVEIEISDNGLNGHLNEQHAGDREDIYPVPAGGCPAGSETPETPDTEVPAKGKVEICHATGSDKNPYVTIEISENGLNGHLNEQHAGDREDIYPVPAGGCPVATTPTNPGPTTPTPPTDTPTTPETNPTTPGTTPTTPGTIPTDAAAGAGGTPNTTGETPTAGAADGSGTPDAAAQNEATAGAGNNTDAGDAVAAVGADDSGNLPFTGLALGGLLLAAIAAIGAGIATRRANKKGGADTPRTTTRSH